MLKKAVLIVFCLIYVSTSHSALKVILDTDPSYDPDDTGCMAMLHGLANAGEVEILAVMNVFTHFESPLAVSAVNHFYNRRAIPVGDYKAEPKTTAPETNYDHFLAHHYPHDLKHADDAPDATRLYREILASAEDGSVTIIVIGTMHNMAGLFRSEACQFSDLDGIRLVQKKVKQIVTMGGNFINHVGHDRTNWGGSEALCRDDRSWACLNPERNELTRYVIDNCPVSFIASGWENGNGQFNGAEQGDVRTGQGLKQLADDHIIRAAYEHHFASRGGRQKIDRHSNDQCALLYAVKGSEGFFTPYLNGQIILTSSGACLWNPDVNCLAGYVKKQNIAKQVDVIESLMMSPVSAPDLTPPEPVSDLTAAVSGHQVILKWTSASDTTRGSWVVCYNVNRDGMFIGKAYGNQFTDKQVPAAAVEYSVSAVNVNGIESRAADLMIVREK